MPTLSSFGSSPANNRMYQTSLQGAFNSLRHPKDMTSSFSSPRLATTSLTSPRPGVTSPRPGMTSPQSSKTIGYHPRHVTFSNPAQSASREDNTCVSPSRDWSAGPLPAYPATSSPRALSVSPPTAGGNAAHRLAQPPSPSPLPRPPGYEGLMHEMGGLYTSRPRSYDDDDGNTTTSGSYVVDSDHNMDDSIIST